jgi:lysophospholipase
MTGHIEYFRTTDGAKLRTGWWDPTHKRPGAPTTVLILQGRASFLEKFEKIIEGLRYRGYQVCAFDWRGQGLSSRQLKNPRKGHIDSYDTYLKDLHEIVQDFLWPRCHGPLIVLGQSMGSHLALRYMTDYAHCFDMGTLTAPLIDLNTGGYPQKTAQWVAKAAVKLGFSTSFVMGHRVYDPIKEPFEGNMLTHDRESFLRHRTLQKMVPPLSIGGVTYGWAHATFNSIDKLTHPQVLGKIKIPILVIGAGQEVVVNNERLQEVTSWIPRSQLTIYEQARHQILSETPEIMDRFWKDFESFVGQLAPSQPRNIDHKELKNKKVIYPSLPNDCSDIYYKK